MKLISDVLNNLQRYLQLLTFNKIGVCLSFFEFVRFLHKVSGEMTRLWGNVVGNELCLDLAMFPHYGLTVLTFLQHQVQKNIGCFFARKKPEKVTKLIQEKKRVHVSAFRIRV